MTADARKNVLLMAFGALEEWQRKNLRWHAEQGTPVCCGDSWERFLIVGLLNGRVAG